MAVPLHLHRGEDCSYMPLTKNRLFAIFIRTRMHLYLYLYVYILIMHLPQFHVLQRNITSEVNEFCLSGVELHSSQSQQLHNLNTSHLEIVFNNLSSRTLQFMQMAVNAIRHTGKQLKVRNVQFASAPMPFVSSTGVVSITSL